MADKDRDIFNEDNFKKFEDFQKKQKQETNALLQTWQSITSEIFGVSGAAFFGEVERSADTMEKLSKQANVLKGELEGAQIALGKGITEELKNGLKDVSDIAVEAIDSAGALGKEFSDIDITALSDSISNITNKQLKETLEGFDTLEEKYKVLVDLGESNGLAIAGYTEETRKSMFDSLGLMGKLEDSHQDIITAREEYNEALEDSNITSKKGLTIMNGLNEMSESFRNSAIKAVFDWDKISNSVQRDSGILLSEMNSMANADFTSGMARFGMSLTEAGQMVGEIGEELQTTSMATKDMALAWGAVSMATGVSTKEVAEMGANLIKMGYSTEQVNEYFEEANGEAKMLGVNSRKVLQSINRNLKKMRSFGFVEGEKSLARMAARAEQLRINIDEVFDVAERARTIEGAMQMAADLQLAAGSFSKLNPMDLLAAARKGPAEMLDILSKMGSDIGRLNDDGTFSVDPIDGDRLRMVAEATGYSYDSLFAGIERNALDAAKTVGLALDFDSMAEGLDMDPEMLKSSFADMLESDGNGGFVLTTDGKKFLEKNDIDSLANVNTDNLKKAFEIKQEETKNIEEQAASNMAFRQSMDAFVASLTNTLTVFQPLLEWSAEAVNWFNEIGPGWVKGLVAGLVMAVPMIAKIVGKGFSIAFAGKVSKGAGGGLTSLAKGLGELSKVKIDLAGVGKFALAIAMVGGAVVGFSYLMAEWGGEASMGQMATAAASLAILGTGVWALSKITADVDMGGIVRGALAMLLIGGALVPFAFAMQMMSNVTWPAVVAALGFMVLSIGIIYAIGAFLTGPQIAPLLIGLAILLGIGATMIAVAYSLILAGDAFEKLSKINWVGFSGMGDALMSAAPGMAAFGLASLLFASPTVMIGMLAMTGNLALLNAVMNPLADSLVKAADSMDTFVEAMGKIKDIDTGKLEEMRELADSMAKSSRSSALNNIAAALSSAVSGGSSGSGGGVRKIEIKLIGDNGREIKHKILKDTATQSGR